MIIAHKGNINGPNKSKENSIPYLIKAIKLGYGIEFDIRKIKTKLIISHDPVDYHPSIDAINLKLIDPNAFMAINIKEFGLSDILARILPGRNGFVFDFELININCIEEIKKYKSHGFKIAKRISDSHPTLDIDYDYLWIDEMKITNSIDLSEIDLSKCFYVSPEIHGRTNKRNEKFAGICTDYVSKYLKGE